MLQYQICVGLSHYVSNDGAGGFPVNSAHRTTTTDDTSSSGFGVVDEKGRLSLTKTVRHNLGIEPGSRVAYVLMDGAVLIVPEDKHLEALMQKADVALTAARLTTQDLLDELPAARDAVVLEVYGADFVRNIEQRHATQRSGHQDT
jgi:bifunctional DNA-binding transcriptional regulator/antitoxin component of YhaV-PrlF toxin-antitoxin module